MVIADELGAAELDEPGDRLADDDRTEVANVHLLRGVRRRVVDDDLAATHNPGSTGAPLGFIPVLAQPGTKGLRRELEINEARTSDLDLNQGLIELARRLDGVHQGGRQGTRVGLGLLGRSDGPVGLEVGVTRVGRTQLRLEGSVEARDGRGDLPQQRIKFSGRIEPNGHASSRKPLRPLGKRRRRRRARRAYFKVIR